MMNWVAYTLYDWFCTQEVKLYIDNRGNKCFAFVSFGQRGTSEIRPDLFSVDRVVDKYGIFEEKK